MPEAMFLTFNPIGSATATWEMDKLGEWIQPSEVILGGSPHLHGIDSGSFVFDVRLFTLQRIFTHRVSLFDCSISGVRMTQINGDQLFFGIMDAPVVNMGLQGKPCDTFVHLVSQTPQRCIPDPHESDCRYELWLQHLGLGQPVGHELFAVYFASDLAHQAPLDIMWWPFNDNYKPVPGEENLLSRYQLSFN